MKVEQFLKTLPFNMAFNRIIEKHDDLIIYMNYIHKNRDLFDIHIMNDSLDSDFYIQYNEYFTVDKPSITIGFSKDMYSAFKNPCDLDKAMGALKQVYDNAVSRQNIAEKDMV